jgi:hypothetical protein
MSFQELGHSQAQRENHMKIPERDSHLLARKRSSEETKHADTLMLQNYEE